MTEKDILMECEQEKKEFFIKKCFEQNKSNILVKHLIDSYNDFVFKKIDDIIEGFNPIEISSDYIQEKGFYKNNIKLIIKNPSITKPQIVEKDGSAKIMTPSDARNRNFTYASPLNVDIYVQSMTYTEDSSQWMEETKKINNVCIGKIPIMVRSKYCILSNPNINLNECKYDYGGYFIINGNEKVVVSQDRIAENKTYVFTNNKCNTYSHIAEIRSVLENKFSVPKTTTLKLTNKSNQFGRAIRANIHHIKHDVPIIILFRALGLQSDKEIAKYIFLQEINNETLMKELIGSIEEGNNVTCQRDAFEYLSKYLIINRYNKNNQEFKDKKLELISEVLTNEFLPHCGKCFKKKALFLGSMVSKLIKCYLGIIQFDDRDSYVNKRIDTPGILIANLLRQYYGKMIKDAKNMMAKDMNNPSWKSTNKILNIINDININKVFKSTTIESGLKYGFATGNWGIKTNKTKQGVAQVLNRLTYMSTVSHLRRVITPVEKAGKLVQPRKLHATQFGIICPAETPEGSSVGLVKNLSLLASITISSQSDTVREFIKDKNITIFDGTNINIFTKDVCKIIVNGDIIGVYDKPKELYEYLKKLKYENTINSTTGITWDVFKNEINVCTEGGRCVRPLIRVIDKQPLIDEKYIHENEKKTWEEVVKDAIEYLDVEEANHSLIAMNYSDIKDRYTHLEPDPAFMLGVLAASIPFSNHNQSPRNCYQCLSPEEEVLMSNGMRKKIKDVKVGDMVLTFDNNMNMTNSKVIHQYVRPTDKIIYKIKLQNNIAITATSNHPFMTYNGWRKVEELTTNDYIGIYTNNTKYYDHTIKNEEYVMTPDYIDKYGPFLKHILNSFNDHELFNLKNTDERLPIIARLFGFLSGQSFMKYLQIDKSAVIKFKSEYDRKLFKEDMHFVGFKCSSIHDIEHSNNVLLPYAIQLYFRMLMKNENNKYCIPSWIMKSTKLIKYEFIKGYQSFLNKTFFDTLSITSQTWNFSIYQIEYIYKELGIECEVFAIQKEKEIVLFIDDNITNVNKIFDIGVQYNAELNTDLYIHKYLSLYPHMDFRSKGNMVFIPLKSKKVQENTLISDITVESNNHSFITTGGILSSNSSMGKQAIGVYTSNFRQRFDTIGHVLNYPQRALVQTNMARILNNDSLPCGVNAIVAIATYTGFNQEDSVMMNKAAIDRGLFVSTAYKTFKEQNNKNHSTGEEEFFCNPLKQDVKNLKPFNYDKIQDNGFVPENTYVTKGDVIIGKCMPNKEGSVIYNKDSSVSLKANECGYIDKNFINDTNNMNINGDGYVFSKVRIRNTRVPCIGDKFSSRHGQKGTVGMIYNQQDMPFMADGTVPDIIINPHAIPSRMTIAQLMECVFGKACCAIGAFGDGSPFSNLTVDDIAKVLENNGMEKHGNEIMYNSRTGEQIHTLIFCGPTYYQRLKHMVNDKVHSRSSAGPVVLLTRQPAEGRARDGGLRLGEMEVECNWAHGIAGFLKERFMECSDNYRLYICKKCGMAANVNYEKNICICKPCKNKTYFSQVRIPYASKLLFQEVQTMGISTRMICN